MSITNDDMQVLMNETRQFAEAFENGDHDAVYRIGKHIAIKLNLLADNAVKRKGRRLQRLRPQASYVGQVGQHKKTMLTRTQPLTDTKWVELTDVVQGEEDQIINDQMAMTPEQVADMRKRYNIPEPTDDPSVDYQSEFANNDTPQKRVKKE